MTPQITITQITITQSLLKIHGSVMQHNSDEYKMSEVENCCSEFVERRTQKVHVLNYDPYR